MDKSIYLSPAVPLLKETKSVKNILQFSCCLSEKGKKCLQFFNPSGKKLRVNVNKSFAFFNPISFTLGFRPAMPFRRIKAISFSLRIF